MQQRTKFVSIVSVFGGSRPNKPTVIIERETKEHLLEAGNKYVMLLIMVETRDTRN